jgi:hypothetical protein
VRNEHRYKWLTDASGHRVKIDGEIAPLIRRLWDMALTTCNSCQDNFGYVWVEFASADDAAAFLSVVVQNGDSELSNRASQPYPIGPEEREKLITHYHAWADSWLIAAAGVATATPAAAMIDRIFIMRTVLLCNVSRLIYAATCSLRFGVGARAMAVLTRAAPTPRTFSSALPSLKPDEPDPGRTNWE